MWRKGISNALLVGLQSCAATVENSVEFPQKIKNGTAFWPTWFHCWEYTPRILKRNSKELMHPYVHSSAIYNNQVLETTYVSISRWADKKAVVHLHNGILQSS